MSSKSNAVPVPEAPRRVRGLLAAAVAAWAFLMIAATIVPLAATGLWSLATGEDSRLPSAGKVFGFFGPAAMFGLPISLVVCFTLGYPAWRWASARGRTGRRDAAKIGAIIGAALCLLVTVAGHVVVLLNGSTVSYAQGAVWLTKNSLPTLHGILFDVFLTAFYAAVGAVAGLAAWWGGGEKSAPNI